MRTGVDPELDCGREDRWTVEDRVRLVGTGGPVKTELDRKIEEYWVGPADW